MESEQITPGVVVQRRSFLSLAAAALGVTTGTGLARSASPLEAGTRLPELTLQEFLDEVVPVAKALKADTSAVGQDRYLHTLASYAVRLGDVAEPELRPSGQGPDTFIGASWIGDPFIVLHWRMEPGSVIRPHAHTYGNVCTLGLEGRARIRNFETLEDPDFKSREPVLLRETCRQQLTPGRIGLVPLTHGFVHGFEAGPEGARGLDITTRLHDRAPTPYLELEAEAVDAGAGVFRGRWTE